MKFTKKFQEGGEMPAGAPQEGQPSPEDQIVQVAQQLLSQIGPEGCMMLIQVLGQMLQEAQAQPAPQGQPVMARKGTKLVPVGRKQTQAVLVGRK